MNWRKPTATASYKLKLNKQHVGIILESVDRKKAVKSPLVFLVFGHRHAIQLSMFFVVVDIHELPGIPEPAHTHCTYMHQPTAHTCTFHTYRLKYYTCAHATQASPSTVTLVFHSRAILLDSDTQPSLFPARQLRRCLIVHALMVEYLLRRITGTSRLSRCRTSAPSRLPTRVT